MDSPRRALIAALPPLILGLGTVLDTLAFGVQVPVSPRQLAVRVFVTLVPLILLVAGSLLALTRRFPGWSYAWVSAALMGLAQVLMTLGDQTSLFSPAVDAVIAVLFVLAALGALGAAALRGWAQAGLVSIGFAATLGVSLCSAVGRGPFHRHELALLAAPLGMVLSALAYLYARRAGPARIACLIAIEFLNCGVLWMAGSVWRVWRTSRGQGLLPLLVVLTGALLSGPVLALSVRPIRRVIGSSSS